MDKYEFRIKTEQIQKLKDRGDYLSACKIAETIDWSKVKSISMLCDIAEIYDKTGKYSECKEVLMLAYDRSPIGRMIVYRLAEVNIKLKEFDEAQEYFEDFLELAPRDAHKYILKYKLMKAKDAKNEELISILEDLKASEFTEQWAYELAYLYHKTGLVTKCVEECDDLFLWFGQGKYVEKALELKMLYEPLTEIQQERYDESKRERISRLENPKNVEPEVAEDSSDIEIKPVEVSVGKYNTINLQKELAKNLEQIMSATQKDTVTATMDNIKKLVEESQIPQLRFESAESKNDTDNEDDSNEEEIANAEENAALKIDFKNFLSEEYDGQISLCVPKDPVVEKQITGQMSIEDVLAEWERTKKAAKEALERDEQRKLETARAHALKKTEDILEKLADIPQPDETDDAEEPAIMIEEARHILDNHTIEFVPEVKALYSSGLQEKYDVEPEDTPYEDVFENYSDNVEIRDSLEDDYQEDKAQEEVTEEELQENVFNDEEETYSSEMPLLKKQNLDKVNNSFELTDEQKDIFTYFLNVKGMKKHLSNLLDNIIKRYDMPDTSESGNIIISGNAGSGKTKLATSIIKSLQTYSIKKNAKIGKINGTAINNKNIRALVSKLDGGYFIIEKAGEMNSDKIAELSSVMSGDTKGLTVIIEDNVSAIRNILEMNLSFAAKFTENIDIPKFSNDELIEFGKSYALEEGYEIDEMGILALYNRVGNIQYDDTGITLEEVIEIIDEAIDNSLKVSVKKALGKVFSKKQKNNGRNLLKEKDFE